MSQPTPEEARKADQPETIEELRRQLQKYRMLHSVCKRFINKHKIRSRADFAPLIDQRHLIEDICDCIGYDP